MKFAIVACYTTGDSFGSENVTDELEYEWENEEIAKKNLNAIADHYRAYRFQEDRWYDKDPKIDYLNAWWFRELPYGRKDELGPCMWLLMDDMVKVPFTCPWIGYFESLNSVELKIKSTKIEF